MSQAVRLDPAVWEGVDEDTEALLESWKVTEGATVGEGDPLAVAVLVKTSIDVTAPVSGTLIRILVPRDATFGRDQDLAIIE
jgi:pyruvate/2-oxoglutarate dehydrogenase complex dihydrolipoamide acyltransferase (E2) component